MIATLDKDGVPIEPYWMFTFGHKWWEGAPITIFTLDQDGGMEET